MNGNANGLTRRAFGGSAMAASLAAASGARAVEQALRPTTASEIGPFYPIDRLAEDDADLTWIKGHASRAKGTVIEVTGRVLDRRGNPVRGAILEAWQANAAGRYAHAADLATAPPDPDFQGFATLRTGPSGEWRMTTIKPAAYDSPIGKRTPHIHFDVRGRQHRLIAQMFFADDGAMNAQDMLYRRMGEGAGTSVAQLTGPAKYRWDVVLMEG